MKTVAEKLIDINVISSKCATKTTNVFNTIYKDILDVEINKGSDFIDEMWSRWQKWPNKTNCLNGLIFEALIATLLWRKGITPLNLQAHVSFVPNVTFDFVMYTEEYGVIVLSAKTSLRERYKQADLEGMLLRHVHRNAKSFLITMDTREANVLNDKIEKGQALGLDEVVVGNDKSFDNMIDFLLSLTFVKPEKVTVIKDSRFIEAV